MAAPEPGFVTPVKPKPLPKNEEEEEEEEEYSPAVPVPLSAITPGPNTESTRGTAVNWGEWVGNPVPALITPKPLDKKLFGAPGRLQEPAAPPTIQPKGPHPRPYYGRRSLKVRLPRRGGSRHEKRTHKKTHKKGHKKTHKKSHKKRHVTRRVRFDRI